MALMATLRCWSRSMASMLVFWTKKRAVPMAIRTMTTVSSITVKPGFWDFSIVA